jgi:hypothetical protein
LIDAEGNIRYSHFGEGGYEATDKAIAGLLKEIGVAMGGAIIGEEGEATRRFHEQSPETYLSSRSWPSLGNAQGEPSDAMVTYPEPEPPLRLHKYYLMGDWQLVDDERQVLRSSEGEIRMKFLGAEANLVLGVEGGGSVEAEVLVDGKLTKTFTVRAHDLYNLFEGKYSEHALTLKFKGKGVAGYAWTFGA